MPKLIELKFCKISITYMIFFVIATTPVIANFIWIKIDASPDLGVEPFIWTIILLGAWLVLLLIPVWEKEKTTKPVRALMTYFVLAIVSLFPAFCGYFLIPTMSFLSEGSIIASTVMVGLVLLSTIPVMWPEQFKEIFK